MIINANLIIDKLEANIQVFNGLFSGFCNEELKATPLTGKWCITEIVNHLYDEEKEDFRARVKYVLEGCEGSMSPIDPEGWVASRNYIDKDYAHSCEAFLEERRKSVAWLRSLEDPDWELYYESPHLGKISAGKFLLNWMAHDWLHIRQITRLQYSLLSKGLEDNALLYAGDW